MRDEANLKSYILRRFLLVLIFIGIAQIITNMIFVRFLGPVMGHLLQIDGLLNGADVKQAFGIVIKSALVYSFMVLLEGKGYHLVDFLSKRILSQDVTVFLSDNFSQLKERNVVVWIVLLILCIALIIILWIAPYIIGGTYFSISVARRVKKLEEKRIEKEREAERQKSLLLSDIAHDLKTPITTIAGFSKALAEEEIEPDKREEYLASIYHKSMQTSELVTLLFEYVKLDSAGFELKFAREDLMECLREVVAEVYTEFEEKKFELELAIPEEPCFTEIDHIQFARSVRNLLMNALKHNPEGTKVLVSAEIKKKEVIIQISDSGVFIEREVAMHLFDPFVQGDKSRKTGRGSGLGLSICKKIIDMHGGMIRLVQYKDKKDYVKTFEIQLPMR